MNLLRISVFLFLCSCGYQWTPKEDRFTVSVPFVAGDEDGALTQELIWALSRSGLAKVKSDDANYRLEVQIVEAKNDTVGFRRDKQIVKGKTGKNLLACEGRKTVGVEVTVFKKESEAPALGPFRVTADADYDYVDGDSIQDLTFTDSQGQFITVLPFSLGQLESTESAQEAATKPLYRNLAQKIVDVISSEW